MAERVWVSQRVIKIHFNSYCCPDAKDCNAEEGSAAFYSIRHLYIIIEDTFEILFHSIQGQSVVSSPISGFPLPPLCNHGGSVCGPRQSRPPPT